MSRPANALIVDDEAHVRTYLRVLLAQLGIETFWEAADGASALAMVQQHHPELMLLDINLPVKSGLTVLREVQGIAPDLPVIIVSSQSAIKVVQEAIDLGALGFVLKQAPKEEALATIRDALEALDEEEGAADEDAESG